MENDTLGRGPSPEASGRHIAVALARCTPGPHGSAPAEKDVREAVGSALDAAGLFCGRTPRGLRVLVKPNLLCGVPLACTSPSVVAAACAWLESQGAVPLVADSPGFGTVRGVARSIGLNEALAPLGLKAQALHAGERVLLRSGDGVVLAREALESDAVLSVPRVKAHSQMRLTLSCKNLYGCVPGLRKALLHAGVGQVPQAFADMQSSIFEALPPVSALVDGTVAMHVTGPAKGEPFALGLICASASPVAADETLCGILGIDPNLVPLQTALVRRGHPDSQLCGAEYVYPLLRPEHFRVEGFVVPQELKHTSFRPGRLLKSCLRRLWCRCFR